MAYQSAYTGQQIDEAVKKAKALPESAAAGQFLSVKEVDADGKPTAFETTDIWSEKYKSSMVSDVLAALPTWTGGSY